MPCLFKNAAVSLLLGFIFFTTVQGAKRTSTKTQLDIRVVRSPQQPADSSAAYILASQARSEEGQSAEEQKEQHHHQVSVVTEEQYQALLKQAQKALQGYDLTKLSAAAHQAESEMRVPKVVYKPEVQVKYVYADAPLSSSASYNNAPTAYTAAITAKQTHHDYQDEDHGYDHYSKHKFGYRVHDPHSGAAFGHSEVSEGHVTRGHYHVLLPDGRLQNVKYVADPSGYHATVTYEKQY